MKKNMIIFAVLVIASIIIADAAAEAGIEGQVNYFFSQNNIKMKLTIENASQESYAKLQGSFLKIEKDGKELDLDLNSFKVNKANLESLEDAFRPSKVIISYDDGPKIIFFGNEELFSIRQEKAGMTKIFFLTPANEVESSPSVFIVEHYYPDKETTDNTRKQGTVKLTVIAKNNPLVEITNMGITVLPESLRIGARSFFEANLTNVQIDVLSEDRAKEIAFFKNSLSLVTSSLNFDYLFDRGYRTSATNYAEEKITGFDVTPQLCSKLGFVFMPGYGYDFIGRTNEFTNHNGWVLGIAYSRDDDFTTSLSDMAIFVNKAYENNLTPIVRVDSETDGAISAAAFISRLSNVTDGKLVYVQLQDKPNVKGVSPDEYASYVAEVRKNIVPDIKLISAAIMPMQKIADENSNDSYTSKEYLEALADIPGFIENIDYLGAYSYNMSISGKDCMTGKALYPKERICTDDITSYRAELETIKKRTGTTFSAIITDSGYPLTEENLRKTQSLLQSFKEDRNVFAAVISTANSWKEAPGDAWLNEDSTLTLSAKKVAQEICI